jgi:signal transduction histidine kinase
MFDPFQQGDSSKTRRHGGLGLGLTIAHRMARKIEGRLTFESEPGKGSRFYLSLPLNENATATTTK